MYREKYVGIKRDDDHNPFLFTKVDLDSLNKIAPEYENTLRNNLLVSEPQEDMNLLLDLKKSETNKTLRQDKFNKIYEIDRKRLVPYWPYSKEEKDKLELSTLLLDVRKIMELIDLDLPPEKKNLNILM